MLAHFDAAYGANPKGGEANIALSACDFHS
jgi:hypothetical protein